MRVTGKYPSFRNQTSMSWESFIERDCFIRLDAEPNVDMFREQPAAIYYEIGGVRRTHFPDVVYVAKGQKKFYEIKSHTDPDLDNAITRGNCIRPALITQGIDYQVITDIQIRCEPEFSNAKLLLRLGRQSVDLLRRESLRRYIAIHDVTWHDIVLGCFGTHGPHQIARLILEGTLFFDRSRHIDNDTVINTAPFNTEDKGDSTWL